MQFPDHLDPIPKLYSNLFGSLAESSCAALVISSQSKHLVDQGCPGPAAPSSPPKRCTDAFPIVSPLLRSHSATVLAGGFVSRWLMWFCCWKKSTRVNCKCCCLSPFGVSQKVWSSLQCLIHSISTLANKPYHVS